MSLNLWLFSLRHATHPRDFAFSSTLPAPELTLACLRRGGMEAGGRNIPEVKVRGAVQTAWEHGGIRDILTLLSLYCWPFDRLSICS